MRSDSPPAPHPPPALFRGVSQLDQSLEERSRDSLCSTDCIFVCSFIQQMSLSTHRPLVWVLEYGSDHSRPLATQGASVLVDRPRK